MHKPARRLSCTRPFLRRAVPGTALLMTLLATGCDDGVPHDRDWRPADAVTPFLNQYEPDRMQTVARLAVTADPDLVFLGDSITQAWLTDGKDVWQQYYSDRNAINCGIGMAETGNLLWRLEQGHFDRFRPRLVVLLIGTNNTQFSKHTPEQIAGGVNAVIDGLLARAPQTHILLLGILPRGRTRDDPYRLNNEATNRLLARIDTRPEVTYRDIGAQFLGPDGLPDFSLMRDPIHLNAQGYARWAASIEADVRRLLGEPPG